MHTQEEKLQSCGVALHAAESYARLRDWQTVAIGSPNSPAHHELARGKASCQGDVRRAGLCICMGDADHR